MVDSQYLKYRLDKSCQLYKIVVVTCGFKSNSAMTPLSKSNSRFTGRLLKMLVSSYKFLLF